jgi:hypothetical protein
MRSEENTPQNIIIEGKTPTKPESYEHTVLLKSLRKVNFKNKLIIKVLIK